MSDVWGEWVMYEEDEWCMRRMSNVWGGWVLRENEYKDELWIHEWVYDDRRVMWWGGREENWDIWQDFENLKFKIIITILPTNTNRFNSDFSLPALKGHNYNLFYQTPSAHFG